MNATLTMPYDKPDPITPARWKNHPVLAIAAALATLGWTGGAQAQATVTCHIEFATMRDGARLATEVYLPGTGRYPVILQRTPYNRNGAAEDINCANTFFQAYAAAGYTVLNQDVRGMYRSDGVFYPMQQEATDGFDAIEWAAAQSWSTGKVGTTGGSYVGLTQWQPGTRHPPHLAAISPNVTASDYHDHWTYVDSVFDLWFAQSWIHVTFGPETMLRELLRLGTPREEANAQVAAWVANSNQELLTNWVWQLPLTSFDVYRDNASYYYTWLDHQNYDGYWKRLDVERRYDDVKVPSLNNGAWYDIFQIGTVANFLGMREGGGTPDARQGSKLIMTCCGHAGTTGAVQWGIATPPVTSELRFFDRYLKGIANGVEDDPAVQLWVLNPPDTGTEGSGFWVNSDVYPLQGTLKKALFLASGGQANSSFGDGTLVMRATDSRDAAAPSHETPDAFTYDPAFPVPTVGGNLCCDPVLLPAGAHDQSTVAARNDVLVYTTEPLREDVTVIGPVKVVLWAASSARDTDFTAKLVDVHLDGFAHNVLDRIVRARYRNGSKEPPSLIEPNKPYEYTIDLGHAGSVFKKGHRIRLEVSSSNFPHYARNLNTGLDNHGTSTMKVAQQTVLHDAGHPSRLILPVVPDVQIPGR